MPKPDAQELELAQLVQENLIRMTRQLQPKDVVPEDAVRTLLGIPKVKDEQQQQVQAPVVSLVEESPAAVPVPMQH